MLESVAALTATIDPSVLLAYTSIAGQAAADITAGGMLSSVMDLAVKACTLIGGALVVFGGVKFGLAIKDQQGGNAMSEALATIGGGAIVIAAGAFFSQIATGVTF